MSKRGFRKISDEVTHTHTFFFLQTALLTLPWDTAYINCLLFCCFIPTLRLLHVSSGKATQKKPHLLICAILGQGSPVSSVTSFLMRCQVSSCQGLLFSQGHRNEVCGYSCANCGLWDSVSSHWVRGFVLERVCVCCSSPFFFQQAVQSTETFRNNHPAAYSHQNE